MFWEQRADFSVLVTPALAAVQSLAVEMAFVCLGSRPWLNPQRRLCPRQARAEFA